MSSPVSRCSGAELVEDRGARGRLVAEHAAADLLLERRDHLAGEAVREDRERRRRPAGPPSPSGRWSCPCRAEASRILPKAPRGAATGGTPRIVVRLPSPSPARCGSVSPPTRAAMLPSVLAPSSPYAAASGSAPQPQESRTMRTTRSSLLAHQ